MEVENKCSEYNFKDKNVIPIEEGTFPLYLQQSVDSIIKHEGYKTYNVFKRQVSTEGGNYLGILYEVDVKGKTKEGDKETNIFIKNIINNEHFKMLSIPEAYLKESYVYKELAKIFTELQDDVNVPSEERYKMAKSYDESNSEAIVLENLSRKGFTTGHRMDVVSLKFAELSIQQLAKFHGLFYVLQKRRPDYFERELRPMRQPFKINDEWKESVTNICQISCQALEFDAKQKVEKFISTFSEKFEQYMEDRDSVGCCVCHGDYRPNNILMKAIDGEITEVIPVDYQLIYYGCPINDFIYFIFTGTDQNFRKLYLNHLKDLYYESLDKFLQYFDMDVNIVYPRKEFEKQFKEKMDYGLMISLFVLQFIFVEEGDVPDFSKDDMTTLKIKLNSKYEERIRGAVDDFIQWGYL